jgi:hypothetical protein
MLTWEIVNNIRNDYVSGLNQTELCNKYDVKTGAMSKIINNKSWCEELNPKKKKYTAFNESKEISEWLKDPRCVVNEHTLDYRIRIKNLDLETALIMPADRGKRWKDGQLSTYNREDEKNRWDTSLIKPS